jgi:hypothetical protein
MERCDGNLNCGSGNNDSEGGGTDKKLVDRNVQQKETRGIETMPRREEDDPCARYKEL